MTTDTAHDPGQMHPVFDPRSHLNDADMCVPFLTGDALDAGTGIRHRGGDLGDNTGLVDDLDANRGFELAGDLFIPGHGDGALGVV